MIDTIFALSSGAPPAAIAVLRISGSQAFTAGEVLAGTLPPPRHAALRRLHDAAGIELDQALVLVFPGPNSATGEDLLELHLHGGRAIVRAVEGALATMPGLRPAEAGEFTRRALGNGRIDLAQAEGLADLLAAETETARRAALSAAEGGVSRAAATWTARLLELSARAEALIDFADEDDVPAPPTAVAGLQADIADLAAELVGAAAQPPTERLHDGIRIVLAGPPNSGKSSLINALADRDVAITAPIAGTTRDRIEAPVVRDGRAYLLIDVAGLRDDSDDAVETIGINRARAAMAAADLVVWLGDSPPPAADMIAVHARADMPGRETAGARLAVSSSTGQGIAALWAGLAARSAKLLPLSDKMAFNSRQLARIADASNELHEPSGDLLVLAEQLRSARLAIGTIAGPQDVEVLLDALFGRFCIGK